MATGLRGEISQKEVFDGEEIEGAGGRTIQQSKTYHDKIHYIVVDLQLSEGS